MFRILAIIIILINVIVYNNRQFIPFYVDCLLPSEKREELLITMLHLAMNPVEITKEEDQRIRWGLIGLSMCDRISKRDAIMVFNWFSHKRAVNSKVVVQLKILYLKHIIGNSV